jgi:RimJ/RimL family protein N-acetyltransferase
MRLVPATAELVRAEIGDRPVFAALLGATIPADWPPEMLVDALPFFLRQLEAAPDQTGWLNWYGLLAGGHGEPFVLMASGGFMGPPRNGTVEVGYSVLPEFQRQGYATEMAAALVDWAFAQPDVRRVIAEAHTDNTPSLRLLRKLGFVEIGPGAEPEHIRFERAGEPGKSLANNHVAP